MEVVNPYANFNTGNFTINMDSFITSLDVSNFLDNYQGPVDDCVQNTLYVSKFKEYVNDPIKTRLDDVESYAEKYIALAGAIDMCNENYDVYKQKCIYLSSIKKWEGTYDENGVLTGQKIRDEWSAANSEWSSAKTNFVTALNAVKNNI